jgi:hypothetical protein
VIQSQAPNPKFEIPSKSQRFAQNPKSQIPKSHASRNPKFQFPNPKQIPTFREIPNPKFQIIPTMQKRREDASPRLHGRAKLLRARHSQGCRKTKEAVALISHASALECDASPHRFRNARAFSKRATVIRNEYA